MGRDKKEAPQEEPSRNKRNQKKIKRTMILALLAASTQRKNGRNPPVRATLLDVEEAAETENDTHVRNVERASIGFITSFCMKGPTRERSHTNAPSVGKVLLSHHS